MKKALLLTSAILALVVFGHARTATRAIAQSAGNQSAGNQSAGNIVIDAKAYQDLRWRNIGPFRGGRSRIDLNDNARR